MDFGWLHPGCFGDAGPETFIVEGEGECHNPGGVVGLDGT